MKYILSIFSVIGLCLFAFQNCGAPGEAGNEDAESVVLNGQRIECVKNYSSPRWNSGPGNISFQMGQGAEAPEIIYERTPYSYSNGSVPKADLNINCTQEDVNVAVTCNETGIRVTPSTTGECASGSTVVTLKLDDQCTGKTDPEIKITVNYSSVCPDMRSVGAGVKQASAGFGSQVAIDGDYMAATAQNHDYGGINGSGALFIYERSGNDWNITNPTIQVPPGVKAFDLLSGVDVRGQYIVAGYAVGDKVFVYQRSGNSWTLLRTINKPTGTFNSNDILFFGDRIEFVSNTEFIVSAYGEDLSGKIDAGAAYIYNVDGNLVQRIDAGVNARASGYFGRSFAQNGSDLIVGAPGKNSGVGDVFHFTGVAGSFNFNRKIVPLNPGTGILEFGFSVAIDGSEILVGAPARNSSQGAAYRFNKNTGVQIGSALSGKGIQSGDNFGKDVSIYNGSYYVSARSANNKEGAIFRFTSAGVQNYKLRAPKSSRQAKDGFGVSFDISNNRIAIGADSADSGGTVDTGMVFVIGVP